MTTFTPHTETLPPAQRGVWPLLSPAARMGFALYGGTAIALHLGHRPSVDFDFFSDLPLDRARLAREMPVLTGADVVQDEPDAYTVVVTPEGFAGSAVKISFFGSIDFGRVGDPEITDDGVLATASLLDLMGTKVKVLLQRTEAKDYQDIAALMRSGVALESGLAAARQLFGPVFQPQEALRALTYFEGGDLDRLSRRDKDELTGAVAEAGALPEVRIAGYSLAPPLDLLERTRPAGLS